jgi:hypothetical protein
MTWQFWGAIVVALISSGVSPAIVPKIIAWKNRKELEDVERRDADRETWFRESKYAYQRVEQECKKCNNKLERYSTAFYMVLEDLEDQVIPMLILPQSEPAELRGVVRAIIRSARIATRDPIELPLAPPEPSEGKTG